MCLCVCVCMCMIITLMFCAFWRDCVCNVESPPPSLVSFPLSSTAAFEKPSSLLHLPYTSSFKPPSAHSTSFALSDQCRKFSHSLVFFPSVYFLPVLWSFTDMHYKHDLKIDIFSTSTFIYTFIMWKCCHSAATSIPAGKLKKNPKQIEINYLNCFNEHSKYYVMLNAMSY